MAEPIEIKRRLAAIFAADVEGYSRLMGADEITTLDALTARREIRNSLIANHAGRIVKEEMTQKSLTRRVLSDFRKAL